MCAIVKRGSRLKMQTMGAGTQPLFDGLNGPLHFADVAIGWHDIQLDYVQGLEGALELVVGVDVAYGKTACLVPTDDLAQLTQDCGFVAVGDEVRCAETDATRNCVEKRHTLYEKEICAKRNVAVVFQDWGRDWLGHKSRCTGGSDGPRRLDFERGNVRAVYDQCPLRVVGRDRTVRNSVASQDRLELGLVGTAYLSVQLTSNVC
jgi:hypothetical protein